MYTSPVAAGKCEPSCAAPPPPPFADDACVSILMISPAVTVRTPSTSILPEVINEPLIAVQDENRDCPVIRTALSESRLIKDCSPRVNEPPRLTEYEPLL